MHNILQPFLLRRLKSDVALELPPKKELIVYCPMAKEQEEMYRAIVNKAILTIGDLNKKKKEEEESQILNARGKFGLAAFKVHSRGKRLPIQILIFIGPRQ